MILEHQLSSGSAAPAEAEASAEPAAAVVENCTWEVPRQLVLLGITPEQLQQVIDFGPDGQPTADAPLIVAVPGTGVAAQQRNAILLIALRYAVLEDDFTVPRDEFNALCKENAIEDPGNNLTGNLKKEKWFAPTKDPSGWRLTLLGRQALKALVTEIDAEETP